MIRKYQKFVIAIILGFFTCFIAIATPSHAINPPTQTLNLQFISNQIRVTSYQQQAESILLAEQGPAIAQSFELTRFSAVLSADDVFPNPTSTIASGAVGAALNGNRLILRGSFRDLSSPLRDYAIDPVNPPNPNITSAVHIHKGTSAQNGPFQYALQVELDASGLSGSLRGEFSLTDEQLQALKSGGLYVDLHTKGFRAGELRGVLKA
jgi:hypothetical protein